MATRLRLIVYGTPQSRGSKRAFPYHKKNGKLGVAVSDANPSSRDWMNCIKDEALCQFSSTELLRRPLRLSLRFYFPRPKGHYGTGRNSNTLKPSAPFAPAVKPDLLKLARAVEDALSGVVYADDAQIVEEQLSKCYGEPARLEIEIEESLLTTTTFELGKPKETDPHAPRPIPS